MKPHRTSGDEAASQRKPLRAPVPVDNFKVRRLPERFYQPPDNKKPFPKAVSLWITVSPATPPRQLTALIALPWLECVRVSFAKFAETSQLLAFISNVNELRFRQNKPPSLCLDTKGPKLRVVGLPRLHSSNYLHLRRNQLVAFCGAGEEAVCSATAGRESIIIPLGGLPPRAKPGQCVLVADGRPQLQVEECKEHYILCRVLSGGRLDDKRSVTIAGACDSLNSLMGTDIDCLAAVGASRVPFDMLALSFTNRADDIFALRRILAQYCLTPQIVAKIETAAGLAHSSAILESADALMVARGDLAVEMAQLGTDMLALEDRLRQQCSSAHKPCIVATRVADALQTAGHMSGKEVFRLHHELLQDLPLTLMLATETVATQHAVRNYMSVCRAIEHITYHLRGVPR